MREVNRSLLAMATSHADDDGELPGDDSRMRVCFLILIERRHAVDFERLDPRAFRRQLLRRSQQQTIIRFLTQASSYSENNDWIIHHTLPAIVFW